MEREKYLVESGSNGGESGPHETISERGEGEEEENDPAVALFVIELRGLGRGVRERKRRRKEGLDSIRMKRVLRMGALRRGHLFLAKL